MRRLPLVLAVLSLAVLLAGCGSRGVTTPAPETVIGSLPKAAEEPATPAFKLKGDSAPDILWESKGKKSVMENYWANCVYHDGYLYGISGHFDEVKMHLNCVDAKTGKLMWSIKNYGKSAITLADGHLFITTFKGEVVLAPCNPQKYEEKARVQVVNERRPTNATIANQRLYLRDHDNIYCLDIAGK